VIDFKKKYIKTIRLNSYRPLCSTAIGLRAIEKYSFPPFIDASCRREPDFQNPNPSITALCRQGLFAPNLYPNDVVIYMTVRGRWYRTFDHHRLIAILSVIDRKESHIEAKLKYLMGGLPIPSNCMVDGNNPYDFDKTAGKFVKTLDINRFLSFPPEKQKIIGERTVKLWDEEYWRKSKENGVFIITKPIFLELYDPPILTDQILTDVFGKVPNTRNPNLIKERSKFKELARLAGINYIDT